MQTQEEISLSAIEELALKNTPLNTRDDIPKGGMNDFLEIFTQNFILEKIKAFPDLCEEARRINWIHNKELEKYGNKTSTKMIAGKVYEGTSGWSKDRLFKHKWIIPNQLKFFMRNLIYIDFWEESNKKVRDSFMKGVMRGDEPMQLLIKVRKYYDGANTHSTSEESITV